MKGTLHLPPGVKPRPRPKALAKADRGQRDKLYGRRWRKMRKQFLTENPLCVMCEDEGRTTPAVELDHIKKHGGDIELFYDVSNLQGLCRFHHRSVKAQMERSGVVRGSNADGTPIDPNHSWNSRGDNV
jgi:5-methylcytosine-specific restriction endonuclease McrA